MRPIPAISAALALLLSVCSASADATTDKTEIIRIENATAAALIEKDLKLLTEFFAADWKLVTSDGSMMTRGELFKALETGKLKFESYELSDLEVRIYGDAAVVIGHGKSKIEWKGESIEEKESFTDVFIRHEGKWQCVSSHSSEFPDADAK